MERGSDALCEGAGSDWGVSLPEPVTALRALVVTACSQHEEKEQRDDGEYIRIEPTKGEISVLLLVPWEGLQDLSSIARQSEVRKSSIRGTPT